VLVTGGGKRTAEKKPRSVERSGAGKVTQSAPRRGADWRNTFWRLVVNDRVTAA